MAVLLMSALGHKRTCSAKRHVRFTPESGIRQCKSNVRYGPKAIALAAPFGIKEAAN